MLKTSTCRLEYKRKKEYVTVLVSFISLSSTYVLRAKYIQKDKYVLTRNNWPTGEHFRGRTVQCWQLPGMFLVLVDQVILWCDCSSRHDHVLAEH